MSSHVYHEIYLHLNWHTKLSRPLLEDSLEPAVHNFLRERCQTMKGVYFHGVGGTATHVHLAVNIEPFVCISESSSTLRIKRSVTQSGQFRIDWKGRVSTTTARRWRTRMPRKRRTRQGELLPAV